MPFPSLPFLGATTRPVPIEGETSTTEPKLAESDVEEPIYHLQTCYGPLFPASSDPVPMKAPAATHDLPDDIGTDGYLVHAMLPDPHPAPLHHKWTTSPSTAVSTSTPRSTVPASSDQIVHSKADSTPTPANFSDLKQLLSDLYRTSIAYTNKTTAESVLTTDEAVAQQTSSLPPQAHHEPMSSPKQSAEEALPPTLTGQSPPQDAADSSSAESKADTGPPSDQNHPAYTLCSWTNLHKNSLMLCVDELPPIESKNAHPLTSAKAFDSKRHHLSFRIDSDARRVQWVQIQINALSSSRSMSSQASAPIHKSDSGTAGPHSNTIAEDTSKSLDASASQRERHSASAPHFDQIKTLYSTFVPSGMNKLVQWPQQNLDLSLTSSIIHEHQSAHSSQYLDLDDLEAQFSYDDKAPTISDSPPEQKSEIGINGTLDPPPTPLSPRLSRWFRPHTFASLSAADATQAERGEAHNTNANSLGAVSDVDHTVSVSQVEKLRRIIPLEILLVACDEYQKPIVPCNSQSTYFHLISSKSSSQSSNTVRQQPVSKLWEMYIISRACIINNQVWKLHDIFGLSVDSSLDSDRSDPHVSPTQIKENGTTIGSVHRQALSRSASYVSAKVAAHPEQPQQASEPSVAGECIICFAAPRTVVLLPCRHLVACYDCAHRMNEYGGGMATGQVWNIDVPNTEPGDAEADPEAGARTDTTNVTNATPQRSKKRRGWKCPICRLPYKAMLNIMPPNP